MKIIVLESTGAGKLSHYSFCLCNELVKKGNEVALITSNNYELDDLEKNFSVQKTSRFYYLKLLRLIRSFKPDVIHFQYLPNPFLDLLYLKFIKLLFRLKLVYTPHNLLPHHKRPYYFAAFNKIYKLVDSVIVHSDFNHCILRDQFAVDPTKIRMIPVGNYNMLFNSCINVSRDKARTKLGLDNHHKTILFFGYVRQDKGVEVLLRAFKIAGETVSNLKLIIAGKPVGEVQPDILIKKSGRGEDVIMDLQYIPLKKAVLYFIASDVVILPYQKVCHSPLIQFAYSFGRPVITTEYGREFVDDGKSGIITSAGDAEDLSKAILKIFSHEGILHDMSRYAKNLAETDFSWETVTGKLLTVYNEGEISKSILAGNSVPMHKRQVGFSRRGG